MNLHLSIIARLAAREHVRVRGEVDPYFVHLHTVAILRTEVGHRVVENEEIYLAFRDLLRVDEPHHIAIKHFED